MNANNVRSECMLFSVLFELFANATGGYCEKKNARYYPVLLCVVCLAPCEWHRCWLLFLHMKHAHDICERAISNWNYSKCEEKKNRNKLNASRCLLCERHQTDDDVCCLNNAFEEKKNSTQTTRPTTLAKRRNWSILLLKNSCVKRVCDPCNRCGILAEAAAAIIAIIQWRLAQRNSTFRTACN